jgi:hypothetical protein
MYTFTLEIFDNLARLNPHYLPDNKQNLHQSQKMLGENVARLWREKRLILVRKRVYIIDIFFPQSNVFLAFSI